MKKRILSMIIAIVMVVGLIPGGALTVFAAETDCSLANPHQIQLPYTSETLNLTYGDGWDHYYTWTAPEAGALTVVMPEDLHCDIRIDGRDPDSGTNTTLTVDVAAGEVVILNVYPLSDVNGTWSASFAAGETTTPEGGETTAPEGGETTTPEGGEATTPEGGEVTGTLEIYLKLKAVNAEGEDISDLGNGLDVVLNGVEWVGTYSGTGDDDGKFNVIIGENTLSGWDYCPTGYDKPADVTFTVAADGTVTCNDSHVTVEKDGDFTVLVITLEASSSEGGEDPEPTPETMTVYFQNNWLWTNVSLYYSMEDSNSIDNWPGEAMVYYGNDGTYDVYSYELPVDVAYFVINGIKDDGSGDRDKTPNITEGFYDGICYYMMWNDGNAVGSEHIDVIFPPTTVDIYLKLKAVNAEGEDISNLGSGLDALLNGGDWVGTYSDMDEDGGIAVVIIGENTLSGWDYCPTGYLKPADVTFTAAADGTVTCDDSHVTVEKDGDFTVLVITLEASSSESGETTTPEGGETTTPEGGETTGTLDIYLKLKAVNAEGEDISNLGNGLDVVLNGGEWVGTYSGTGDDDGKFNVIIGENTLNDWDYCPTGYDKPADVTFTVAADGTVTCNDSHVTVEKDGDFTVLVITLEASSSEGGETTTPEGGEISIPEGAVEITDQNALPDLSASYDSTVGWSGELNPDDNVGYFSLDLKAGDVLYYTYVGEAYYFYLFENDRYDSLGKRSTGSPLPKTDFFTIEADGNYTFCSGQELTLHAWLVRGSAGEGGETTTPEGGDTEEISIPDDAVEITSNDTDGLPEEVVAVLGSYDAANGYWVPFEMDTQYIFFAKNLNEGDELYLVFSEATQYIFGVMTSPGDRYTANGIVRFAVTASDTYSVITESDVKLKAYVVPADSGESGEEPVCAHENTMLSRNSDGTHNIVCADEACQYVVEANVTCTVDDTRTQEVVLFAATCCKEGTKQVITYCECGYTLSNDEDIPVPATGEHGQLTEQPGLISTCQSAGYKSFWRCTNGGFFEDEGATIPIEAFDAWRAKGGDGYVPVDPGAHCLSYGIVNNGDTHSYVYSCCDTVFESGIDHYYVNGVCACQAVCTHENTRLVNSSYGTHNVVCAIVECSYIIAADVACTVDDTKTQEFEIRAANCCREGIKQVVTFCACGFQLSNDADIPTPATGEHGQLTEQSGKEPNCQSDGYKSSWACANSGLFEDEGATVAIDDYYTWIAEGGDGYLPVDPTKHISDNIQYTKNDDTHDGIYTCCGGEYVTDEPHDFTHDAENHECICGKVEPVDLIFVLNGGTLTGEAAEMWGENGENGTIPLVTEYGKSVLASDLYYSGALIKDGYSITGFKDQDGNFYDISNYTDTITFDGDTTLTVQWAEDPGVGGEGGETGHTHTYDNGYYYSNGEYHYAYCDTCEYYDPDSAEAHYEDAAYPNHHCDVCGVYVRAWCTPIDPETDHYCINGENCGARLDDLCTDADNDHVCDGCGDDMRWLCEDTGADHLCDVCGAYMRELCEDADGDHICDAEGCGERISSCDDADNDNKCDICDAELRAAWNDTDDDGVIDEGETVYSFLDHAFVDPAATIIKLLDDVSDFNVFFGGKAVTLDLNGHTVTLNGWFDVTTAASLTIKDSSTAKTGRIICDVENNYYMDVYSDGTLTLQGGTVDQMRLDDEIAAITLTGGTVGKMIVRHGEVILGDTNVAEWKISGGIFNVDPTTLNGFDSDNYKAVNNNDGTWTVQEKSPDDFVDEHFHDKEGYEIIWSENFDGETFPESFTAVDKDGDGHGWQMSSHDEHVHGCTYGSAVISCSYVNETSTPLNSNNLLLTPTLELEEGKEYLLSFMVKAVDERYPDSYDIHISLDGGETYTWSRGLEQARENWEEIELDLSEYAGNDVTVVIEHEDYDMFYLALDCFYLYEKSATGGEGGSEGEEFTGVSLYASSLTLDGTIGLNFYYRLGDEVLASQDAFVRFSLEDGRIIEIPVSEGVATEIEGVTYYKFTCQMYAKQMADTVKVRVFDGETALGYEFEHSIVNYADGLLQRVDTNAGYAAAAPLIKSMLHYGARAQLYFGYNTEKLADAGIDAVDLSGVTTETFESYKATGMTIDGIGKFVSSNLVLESETTLKLYFLVDEGVDASALEFTVGDEVITPTTRGEYLVISITDIKADELDNEFTVTVTNGTEAQGSFTTSVYAYCYKTLLDEQGLYNNEIKDTLKALYLYNVAADAYFN